jgi:hypothetical protein
VAKHGADVFFHHLEAIANGTTKNIPIKLTTLGIGNGLTDPKVQYPQYAVYAQVSAHTLAASALN